jgi:serine/threonine-protein kinase
MASAASTEPTLERVGSISLGERIAVGGMAEVFRGTRPDGAAVIVKVLLPQYTKEPEVVALFEHEAALGERLRHPNLVPVLARGNSPRGPYLVAERVDGSSVADVARAGRLGLAGVLAAARDVLAALAFVHAATGEDGAALQIVHRDISPDNLLVDRSGRLRLIDFGVARSALRSGRTRTGVVRGKVAYLAPEQVTGSELDARADLYSAGVVLFELATGERYLEGDSEIALLRAAEEPRYRAPSAHGGDRRIDPLLKRALARFPEERYASAAEMAAAFEALSTPEFEREGRAELAARVEALLGPREETPRRAAIEPIAPLTPLSSPTPPLSLTPLSKKRWPMGVAVAAAGVALLVAARFALAPPVDDAPPVANTAGLAGSSGPAAGSAAAIDTATSAPTQVPGSASAGGSAPGTAPTLMSARPAGSAMQAGAPTVSAAPGPIATSSASAPASSAAASLPTSSAAASEPPKIDRAHVQRKMSEVNARIAAAKAKGRDVSAAEGRIAAALEALLDGRYEQSNRELDGILATLPRPGSTSGSPDATAAH